MHLIQLLLPAFDNDGKPFAGELYARVRTELVAHFGGLTVYSRAPAKGLWADAEGLAGVVRDDIVVYEVMAKALDRPWWTAYRQTLERAFAQESLVVRALPVDLL